MTLATLSINEADNTGNGSYWQKLGKKDKQVVEKAGDNHVFSAKSFPVGDMCGSTSCNAGVFPLLADTGTGAEFRLSNTWTEDGDVYTGALQLVFE